MKLKNITLEGILRGIRTTTLAVLIPIMASYTLQTDVDAAVKRSPKPKKSYVLPKYASLGAPDIGYHAIEMDHNFINVKLAPKESGDPDYNLVGRIQRTERWANIITDVQKKFPKIPDGYIYAIIMNESYGDLVQPNASGDGGLGLIHFQPGTGYAYGLKIHGKSRVKGADHGHGKKLKQMIEECNRVVPCIIKYDDRVHPVIIVDAIARYLMDGYDRKKTWHGAVGTINPGQRSYANKIERIRNNISRLKKLAKNDFNERNAGLTDGEGHALTWDHYIKTFQSANIKNYQLEKYSAAKRSKH